MAEKSKHSYEKMLDDFLNFETKKSPKSFPKPCSGQLQTTSMKTHLLSDIFSQKKLNEWPLKVNFPGWRKPRSEWSNWVEKMSLKYAKIWEQTGICDGILSSLHEIKLNPENILGLSEFWCSKNNTFMFPWGEATITLEDVMILGGLPVLGESVNFPCKDEILEIEMKLNKVRNDLSKNSSAKKASYSGWIKYFSEECEEKKSLEHVGFLAYWLSRCVFPDLNEQTVGIHVFRIAVLLSRGVKIALAPAVLACLYQNLTFLTQHAANCDSAKREISVPGPFQVVCLWALERFPLLGSKLAKRLSLGQPRVARWDKVGCKESLGHVRSVLRSVGSFLWRPYVLDLENWRFPSFYPPERELIVSDCSALEDEELKSFRLCLCPQKLVGIDCAEMYRPQRVAMQFGYDQDFPGQDAFSTVLGSENAGMFVASRSLQPVVSQRYKTWWKESMCHGRGSVSEGMGRDGIDNNKPMVTSELVKSELNCDGDHLSNNVAAPCTPVKEILDATSNDSGRKRKHSMGINDWKSQDIVMVDSDEEDVDVVRHKDRHKSSSTTAKEVKRRVGECANNPLYISDQCSKVIRRDRKTGISLENPIDIDSYYL